MIKKEPSYLKYWDINNLFKWTMSQRLLLCGFKWTGETCLINENFIKSYNDDNDEGYFLEVDVQYLENVCNLHNDLLERMKIEKTEILDVNFHDKEIYVI